MPRRIRGVIGSIRGLVGGGGSGITPINRITPGVPGRGSPRHGPRSPLMSAERLARKVMFGPVIEVAPGDFFFGAGV